MQTPLSRMLRFNTFNQFLITFDVKGAFPYAVRIVSFVQVFLGTRHIEVRCVFGDAVVWRAEA